MMALLCVTWFFSLDLMVEPQRMTPQPPDLEGEEPIICLNMSLRIVGVITCRAVITGITVSLLSVS